LLWGHIFILWFSLCLFFYIFPTNSKPISHNSIVTAFTITGGTAGTVYPANSPNPHIPLVKVTDRSDKLAFTLTYHVSYVAIVPNDLINTRYDGATAIGSTSVENPSGPPG
jgi:hypothetical protein